MLDYQKNAIKYFTNHVPEIIELEIYPPSCPDSSFFNFSILSIVEHIDNRVHMSDVDYLKN